MHPAPSLILFTTLSGLGFGLMFWLGLHMPGKGEWVTIVFALMALGLTGIGLLFSLAHLGNPQRFLRALTQWRSSWLSREGILSILTMVVFSTYAVSIVLNMPQPLLGWLAAGLAIASVLSTAMIYAQIRAVPRWHSLFTPVLFLLYALAGGALLAGQMQPAGVLSGAAGIAQALAWVWGDRALARSGSDTGTATGLGHLGQVRQLESPHTGTNYLLREMVHVVGRKHSVRLRVIALAGLLVPALLILFWPVGHMLAMALVGLHLIGVLTARWLFYAEAEHVVGLYYSAR